MFQNTCRIFQGLFLGLIIYFKQAQLSVCSTFCVLYQKKLYFSVNKLDIKSKFGVHIFCATFYRHTRHHHLVLYFSNCQQFNIFNVEYLKLASLFTCEPRTCYEKASTRYARIGDSTLSRNYTDISLSFEFTFLTKTSLVHLFLQRREIGIIMYRII